VDIPTWTKCIFIEFLGKKQTKQLYIIINIIIIAFMMFDVLIQTTYVRVFLSQERGRREACLKSTIQQKISWLLSISEKKAMEIELRLDADGRTTYDPNSTTTTTAIDASTLSSIAGVSEEEDNRRHAEVLPFDYSTKAALLPTIHDLSARAVEADTLKSSDNNASTQYTSLLRDCQVSYSEFHSDQNT
jgi:hypothetical protein